MLMLSGIKVKVFEQKLIEFTGFENKYNFTKLVSFYASKQDFKK